MEEWGKKIFMASDKLGIREKRDKLIKNISETGKELRG